MPIETVIADKNPLTLRGLEQLLRADIRFNLVATASDGERFMEAVERLRFDVAVIGWEMPYLHGRQVLEAMRARTRPPRMVVYTGSPDADIPRLAMSLGAAGFCSKRRPPAELIETIASVAAGRMVFPFLDVATLTDDPLRGLTARERDILIGLARGRTNAQLAQDLAISLNTVKFHLKNTYAKLGARNRADAVARYMALRLGPDAGL